MYHVTFVVLVVALYVAGSRAVTCHYCDPCPHDFVNQTGGGQTCEGSYCEMSLVGDIFKRLCHSGELDSRFDNYCYLDDQGTQCLCGYADFCTDRCPYNCADFGQGIGGATRVVSGHVTAAMVALYSVDKL